ncbi:hypothetical protein BJX61DRAFT_522870 [Aspergillus egyptiacus]|nr:hypothetical protein BJX61DRAFT_522870 [Aspergillus egyptiacus]
MRFEAYEYDLLLFLSLVLGGCSIHPPQLFSRSVTSSPFISLGVFYQVATFTSFTPGGPIAVSAWTLQVVFGPRG